MNESFKKNKEINDVLLKNNNELKKTIKNID